MCTRLAQSCGRLCWAVCLTLVLATSALGVPPELGWELFPGLSVGGSPDSQTQALGPIQGAATNGLTGLHSDGAASADYGVLSARTTTSVDAGAWTSGSFCLAPHCSDAEAFWSDRLVFSSPGLVPNGTPGSFTAQVTISGALAATIAPSRRRLGLKRGNGTMSSHTPRSAVRLVLLCAVFGASGAFAGQAALTPQQIEEDWLQQVKLRLADLAGERQARPELDALGGCDGVINGEYGFHTKTEDKPWWQVDLGGILPLDRLVVYNRGGNLAARASRMRVLLSNDSKQFKEAYQHDGSVFHGHSDGKPLTVQLEGKKARYVRLQLPSKDYFHLDEVQAYAVDGKANVALNKRATQSSVSEWSMAKAGSSNWSPALRATLESGFQLAAALERQGVDVASHRKVLEDVKSAPAVEGDEAWKERYLKARRAIRKMALANPLLDFDSLVFAKRAPTLFPHLSDQYYGWWSRPGGGLYILKGLKSESPELTCLSGDFPEGNFLRPGLSYDAKKLVFAFCKHHPDVQKIKDKFTKSNLPEDAFYHLYEMDLEKRASRQLTKGRYDDFDGRYLPDGDILFLSTRKGTFLQCTQANTAKTLEADLPDSYVRCGGGRYRPVPVFTLHAMAPDGTNMRPLSAFETFEYTPSVTNDGRIVYCRWDYIDRFNGHFFSLWGCNQDGSNAQLVYGNYTKKPQATMEPCAIPGSDKLIFTASAHHSVTGGSLVLLNRSHGNEGEEPLTRLTPEVPFPETEKNVGSFYANPWPLSEDFYLVSWSNKRLPPHCRCDDSKRNPTNAQGLYLYDRFGNLELLYRDPSISSMYPIPLRPRKSPPTQPKVAVHDGEQAGSFILQDVYDGMNGVPKGSIKKLRIVGVTPKVQPEMNRPPIGLSREDTGKFIMGSVPVEEDGSAHFRAPSGIPVFFQALDAEGRSVQTMRSLTYLQPGQTLSCLGCHEPRLRAPQNKPLPLASKRPPSRITPGPSGTLPLRFDRAVQPILDAHCIRCHGPDSKVAEARKKLDLSAKHSYKSLMAYAKNDLKGLVFERDYSKVNDSPSLHSKILKHLRTHPKHKELKLTDADWRRIYAWMDTYGATVGCFSDQQEKELIEWRKQNAQLFEPGN